MKAAKTFEEETGTPAGIDLDSITDRMEIRRCVQTGHVKSAIERVNDLNPEVQIDALALAFQSERVL